jgi:hypothetical protein
MRLPALLSAIAAVLVGAPATATAAPDWKPPVSLSDASMPSSLSKVAVNERGDAVAIWQDTRRSADGARIIGLVRASVKPAGGVWSAPAAVSVSGATGQVTQLEASVQSDGSAVVAWIGGGTATVADISPSGTASTPLRFGDDAAPIAFAANARGDAVIAWTYNTGDELATGFRVRNGATGTWSATDAFGARSRNTGTPAVAIGPAGDAAISWIQRGGGTTVTMAAVRRSTGAFGTPTAVSAAGTVPSAPTVTVDSTGATTLLWASHDAAGSTTDHLLTSTLPAGGATWSSPALLDRSDFAVSSPLVAVDGAGSVTAAWSQADGGQPRVQVATRPAGGAWTAPQAVSPVGAAPVAPAQLKLNPRGDAVIAYAAATGVSGYFGSGFVRRLAGAAWEDAYSLPNQVANIGSISAGLDAAGGALGIWSQGDGRASSVIFASSLDGPAAPAGPPASVPSTSLPAPASVSPGPAATPAPPAPAPARFAATLRASGLALDIDLPRRGKSCPTSKTLTVAVTVAGKRKSSKPKTLTIRSRSLKITSGAGICTVKGTLTLKSLPSSASISVKLSSAKTKTRTVTAVAAPKAS